MPVILNRASRNFLWQHPWQLALAILGITLGVAVVIAIDLAMQSSLHAFEQASKAISGKATHRIVANTGHLDETLYTRLRVERGIRNLSPVIHGTVRSEADKNGEHQQRFKLYGIDPFIEGSFDSVWQTQQFTRRSFNTFIRLMTEQNTVLLSSQTARKLGLGIGENVTVFTADTTEQLKIINLLTPDNALARQALTNVLLSDISTAQELLNMAGKLSAIEVMIAESEDPIIILDRIREVLPAGTRLISSASRSQSMRQMTEAFSINLMALGLLSLLIGMFLIYNTMTFLVVQRRQLIGGLRAIGVTRQQIFVLILKEAFLLALVGSFIGIIVGLVLGQGLLELVSRTIDTLYFRVDTSTLLVTPAQIAKGAFLGIAATLIAVLLPAWEATRQSPNAALSRSQLESGSRKLTAIAGLFGLFCLMLGLGLTFLSDQSITLGLACIFLLLFGFALMTPAVTLLTMKMIERLLARLFGVQGKLPPRLVAAEISRTGIAIAALMIAVAATIGMDLMINSFRETVSQWVKVSLPADLYVSSPGKAKTNDRIKADHLIKENISRLSGVQMTSTVLHTSVVANEKQTRLSVFELNSKSKQSFIIQRQQHEKLWQSFAERPTVFVTESYAYHHGTKIGDRLALQTDSGQKLFSVIAIYTDYSGDQGHLAMNRNIYQRYWPDMGYSGIGIYAQPGIDLDLLENAVGQRLESDFFLRSSHAIYQASMEIFEQTFMITQTLRWLAAGIAFVGVFGALMALQFERTRQLGILRAIGMTPWQLALLINTETVLMGLVAGLFAIPVGYSIALMLVYVVYQRSFGWTMAFYLDSAVFYQSLLLAVVAALLAGVIPALKMARTNPAAALRTE